MRRLLTTLMILLTVLVAGMSALVLLVNPNDFRDYMVRQVEDRSGYQLQLSGPLRWHVWPRLSILSGRMALTAPGAEVPLVRADNMRLDVSLLPLLSHQLKVKQVMLKGAVVQLTPQSEEVRVNNAPIAPKDTVTPQAPKGSGWSFDIAALQMVDSVLVFQHNDDEQITVRDIRLQMEQDEHHQATVDFSGHINRNQRDLTLRFAAQVQAGNYPHTLDAQLSHIDWQLQGADLPVQGIKGRGAFNARWQEAEKKLSFSHLTMTANDSDVAGEGSVILDTYLTWALNLHSNTLNLDNLLVRNDPLTHENKLNSARGMPTLSRPVIAEDIAQPPYAELTAFNSDLSLSAKAVTWRGMHFNDVAVKATNQQGLLTLSQLEGQSDGGRISLPGTLDAREVPAKAHFQPLLDNIQISTLLKAFHYPLVATGQLSLQGDLTGNVIDAQHIRHDWQGRASITLKDARSEGLNFQQLVQQAIERENDIDGQEEFENATRLDELTSQAALNNGILTLQAMNGQSPLLALEGNGALDLAKETCDVQFTVRVTGGRKGNNALVESLKNTAIPLRIYGKWAELQYNLQVDKTLRRNLQDEAKRRLKAWAEKN